MKRPISLLLTALLLTATACASSTNDSTVVSTDSTADSTETGETMNITVTITNAKNETHTLSATLAKNKSAAAFAELLEKGAVTINMHDYGNFEKVGDFPQSLPRTDTQITTEAGDIILYQGKSITIYYDVNSWNFTRLGKISGITQSELKAILGTGNVTATFSLAE